MKFRFTIGRKIGTGFSILILLTIVVFFYTQITLNSSKEINDRIINVNTPSVNVLQQLKTLVVRSKVYITNWVLYPAETTDKKNLRKLISKDYPDTKEDILKLASRWTEEDKAKLVTVFNNIDSLFDLYAIITDEYLSSFSNYEDAMFTILAGDMLNEGEVIDFQTKKVFIHLDGLIIKHTEKANQDSEEMIESFDLLEFVVKYLGLALIIGGALIALFTVRSIVKPVQKLKELLLLLGKGIIPKEKMEPRTDEIGDMSLALNDLMVGFKQTAEFANEVGAGNFKSEYQPLSEQDALGHSLLAMRTDLFDLTSNLEQKVVERTKTIEEQKKEMEVLYTHVTDSIRYAKRIQEAILPPDAYVQSVLPNSFVLYKPKDIVSGDFYWIKKKKDKVFFAAVDCTGHGVPGAFMTIVGRNGLNQAIEQVKNPNPANVLDALNEEVGESLHQKDGVTNVKDGMDAAMCAIDFRTKELEFAGAFNPLYLIRDGEVIQTKGDKFPIGAFIDETPQKFTNNKIQLIADDIIYIFSDGYADQFGGEHGKKFMYKRFRDLLLDIYKKDLKEQKQILDDTIEEWKNNLEQVDDILIIGLRV